MRTLLRIACALGALGALAACGIDMPPAAAPSPPARPEIAPDAPDPPAVDIEAALEESRELRQYYREIQDGLLARGLLRTGGGGPDTPFGPRQLVENFVRIAVHEEYATVGGRLLPRQTASTVHRWDSPVRMQLEFGRTVAREIQIRDRNAVTSYAARLSRLTGQPIRMVDSGGNFHVFIVNEPERRALGPRLREIVPGLPGAVLRAVVDMPRTDYCVVFAVDPTDSGVYSTAVAVIRAEHPDLMRLACIHEELAQGLGLANDSPAARPSIFNDDEEFALLTTHDEYLLRMLYDRRIRPGMAPAEARAAANVIAAEFFPGEG